MTSEVGRKTKFDETAAISGSLCIIGADSIDFATSTMKLNIFMKSLIRILGPLRQPLIWKKKTNIPTW